MSRLIDADAVVQYLHEFRCADCDRRKGMKNGKIQFCYEIGDAPCRACDIGDTIEYFLDEDIAPTIDAIPVKWLCELIVQEDNRKNYNISQYLRDVIWEWHQEDGEQEANTDA